MSKETQLTIREDATPALPARPMERPTDEIIRLVDAIKGQGLTPDSLEKLVTLHERMSDRQAAQEFAEALATFQRECPPIPRKRSGEIIPLSGAKGFKFPYAALEDIAAVAKPVLHRLGLSFSWDTELKDKTMRVTCTLRHVNGHRESSSFTVPTDTRAGMSEQMKCGSASMYGKRQTLIDVLGLTTCDADTPDTPPPGAMEPITASQAADLRALMQEVKADERRFLKLYGVTCVEDLPQFNYRAACAALEEKRK